MAHPFSGIVTPFPVTMANGKRYFANCAWDAIAFHVMLSIPIYRTKMALDCRRPSVAVLRAHFAEMGLTGAVWDL